MRTRTTYIADDSSEFDSQEECAAYEAAHPEHKLIGLELSRLNAVMAGRDAELAAAIRAVAACLPPLSHFERGARDFLAGKGAIVPDDLRADKESAEEWLIGWDSESVRAGAAPAKAA